MTQHEQLPQQRLQQEHQQRLQQLEQLTKALVNQAGWQPDELKQLEQLTAAAQQQKQPSSFAGGQVEP